MLVKPTARTEKSTQILCVLTADVGHPKSTAEMSSYHNTHKICVLFSDLAICLTNISTQKLYALFVSLTNIRKHWQVW